MLFNMYSSAEPDLDQHGTLRIRITIINIALSDPRDPGANSYNTFEQIYVSDSRRADRIGPFRGIRKKIVPDLTATLKWCPWHRSAMTKTGYICCIHRHIKA